MLALVDLFPFSLFATVPLGSSEPSRLVVGALTCVWGECPIISKIPGVPFSFSTKLPRI